MYTVRKVTDDLYYVGGDDRRLALFENIFPIPEGVSYNSYLLMDEKNSFSRCGRLGNHKRIHGKRSKSPKRKRPRLLNRSPHGTRPLFINRIDATKISKPKNNFF